MFVYRLTPACESAATGEGLLGMVAANATLRTEALETRILSGIVKIKLGDKVTWDARVSRVHCKVALYQNYE
jgi:hypothetical protein